MIVSGLFVEQSQPWEALVRSHIEEVARAVKTFLRHIISYIADASTCGVIFQKLVEPTFEDIVKDLKRKTADLLSAH
ncbi:hypothetical protein BS50DRAFT_367754 [Corynespora cassiicola Philippines]|uniref:Uncharacterized protein n=1 Tax=Corynespora cassiicola Philippines TaxID=1448308 RepID=A0A2T2N028_CORCC|nr:hypothetical protein BS50DRAFT_367754 [Corynespora cassiicola Philippines]